MTCGVTQQEIADAAGRSQSSVSAWKRGARIRRIELPKVKYRKAIAEGIQEKVKERLFT